VDKPRKWTSVLRCSQADAYVLSGVPAGWNGGFHMQWFSHLPRTEVGRLLEAFHSRLADGAVVVFGDNVDWGTEPDEDGNLYQWRELSGHPPHRIIKNCPSGEELDTVLAPWSRSITHPDS
jgi:hypothetical protein